MLHNITRPVFDGVQPVCGLWFDISLIGETEARNRILAHWEPASRLHRTLDGYVLEFPHARPCRCSELDGLPLCKQEGVLSSAPLTKQERAQVAANTVCLIRGAFLQTITLTDADRIDPAIWIDLRHIPLREPLEPPLIRHQVVIQAQEDNKALREILGNTIPEPSAQQSVFLRNASAVLKGQSPRQSFKGSNASSAIGAVSLGVIGLLLTWMGAGRAGGTGTTTTQAHRPSTLSPWAQKLSNLTARLTMLTRVSKLLGWRQAAYLRRMMEMFEDGDWEEALRHAIPLNSLQDNQTIPAFGTPTPRDSLTVTTPGRVTTALGLTHELQQHLQQTYRRTFERLDRDGRIDEAAFVLAELLRVGMEAVTYLEKKDRIRQAAELADTVEVPTEVAVRLWWLAGNAERAAQLARRGNAFANAVRLLEKTQSPTAPGLRKLWAEHLAQQGRLTEAVEAIWPLQEYRAMASDWLLQAQLAGGSIGIRGLLHKLMLMPESLADSEDTIMSILYSKDEDGAQLRARLAIELLNVKEQSAATRRLAAEVLRPVIAERAAGANQLETSEIEKLLALADAPMMRADLPVIRFPATPKMAPLESRDTPLSVHLDDRGLQPIYDARCLPDGQYLLALGESGVLRIDQRGRAIAHYPIPAHHLVIADSGQRALALAQRDQTFRISRLDLLTSQVADWISLPLNFWSHGYDGVIWNVILDNRLIAIDVTKNHLVVNWQVADFPGKIIGFAEDVLRQILLIATPDGMEQWRYLLPLRRLNQRHNVDKEDSDAWRVMASTITDEPLTWRLSSDKEMTYLVIGKRNKSAEFFIPLDALTVPLHVQTYGIWLSVITHENDITCCMIIDVRNGSIKAKLFLPQSVRATVSMHDQHIILADHAGRLIDINCKTGQLRTLIVN